MKIAATRYAATAALSGALAFAANCSFTQDRTVAGAGMQVSQYCVPQEPSFDAHRFYCGNELSPVSSPEMAPT